MHLRLKEKEKYKRGGEGKNILTLNVKNKRDGWIVDFI